MATASRGSTPTEDEELKGTDSKTRKRFKPLEAVRKLFSKSRSRKTKDDQVNVVAVKAKSTTALHRHANQPSDDDDNDDGGFQSRQVQPFGGKRSISEDSVFSPDQRETNLQALKKTAVSEESLPKSAFQAELFSKLNKRRSLYSDEDDGLPHSPTPPITTADIIMGGPLKPLPGMGKSTSRESDNSLISTGGSDNDEKDLFQSDWKNSVPSRGSSSQQSVAGVEGPLDFDKMAQTELLKNVAKDRISIKPRARTKARQSRKKRDTQSPHSLPSLNEESPTKTVIPRGSVSDEEAETVRPSVPAEPAKASVPDKSAGSKPSITKPTTSPTSLATTSPPSVSTAPSLSISGTSSHSTAATGKAASGVGSSAKEIEVDKPDSESRVDARSSLKDTKTSDFKKAEMQSVGDDKPMSSRISVKKSGDGEASSATSTTSGSGGGSVMSRWQPSGGVPSAARNSMSLDSLSSVSKPVSKPASGHSVTPPADVSDFASSSRASVSTVESTVSTPSSTSSGEGKREGLRQTDTQASPAFSPKEDYKARRQSRSKTLPEKSASKEEQATKVQRAASHRLETSSSQSASPEASPRLGVKAAQAPSSKEPEWFAIARRKSAKQDSPDKSQSPSPTKESVAVKESAVSSSSVPSASASASSSSSKTETVTKSVDSSSLKVDTVNSSVEVKNKTETISKPVEASKIETASKSVDIINKTESSSKPVDSTSNISVSSASSKFEPRTEPSHFRGGSVKTSPTKTNVLSTKRGGSVKVLTSRAETSSPPTPAPSQVKTNAPAPVSSALKPQDTKESDAASNAKDVPKWKAQSLKSSSTTSSTASSSVSSSRFPSVKAPSTPAQPAASVTQPETKVAASPVKRPGLTKTPSDEKTEEKSSVPAWRANLNPRKSVTSDIKIELIESKGSSSSTAKKEEAPKTSPTKSAPVAKDPPSEPCRGAVNTNRSSKVMNLLKNFENVQGVS